MKKILVFDIETSDVLVSTFGIRDQFIDEEQIVRDLRILAIGAKWLGQPVMYREARKPRDEKALLRWIWELVDEADIVIGHNSKNFDSKVLTARFIVHGMKPPTPYQHLDTLLISRQVARFPSHKLSYITKTINKQYTKLPHTEFPGRTLWLECMKGNPKAWTVMKKYNIHDVLSTEESYLILRAWAPDSAPSVTEDREACRACGSKALYKHDIKRFLVRSYRRYKCQKCGKIQRGELVCEGGKLNG